MIHGEDLARAIISVHRQFSFAKGERRILTDGRIYDWWDLASAWGEGSPNPKTGGELKGQQGEWVRELMDEYGVKALPRNAEVLGRALDAREFWKTFGLSLGKTRLE